MSLEVFQAPATLVSSFHKWMDTKKVPFEKGTFFNALTSFFQDFNSFKVLCNSSSPPPMYIHYVFDFGEERSQRKCQEGDKHTHSKGDSTTRSLVKNDRNFFPPTFQKIWMRPFEDKKELGEIDLHDCPYFVGSQNCPLALICLTKVWLPLGKKGFIWA